MDTPPTPDTTPSSDKVESTGKKSSILTEIGSGLASVLDLSFKTFVTPRVIRILYILSLLGALLSAIGWVRIGFASSLWSGIFNLITAPLAFLIYALVARVLLEVILVIFKIETHLGKRA